MKKSNVTRATLGRLPIYLQFIRTHVTSDTVSATSIARGLHLGEVQVRKDLSLICEEGRPKIGYQTSTLLAALESVLGVHSRTSAIIVGAGRLGRALHNYDGFAEYGLEILAAFDVNPQKSETNANSKPVFPMEELASFCETHDVKIGILTVPSMAAQSVCDKLVACGITAIWSFAPIALKVPENVTVAHENLALSLAHLKLSAQ